METMYLKEEPSLDNSFSLTTGCSSQLLTGPMLKNFTRKENEHFNVFSVAQR